MYTLAFFTFLISQCFDSVSTAPSTPNDICSSPTQTSTSNNNNNNNDSTYLRLPTKSTLTYQSFTPDKDAKKFHVPHSQTTLYFDLGFDLDKAALIATIGAAQYFVYDHIQKGSQGPLDRAHDPFVENSGYGASIRITSVSSITFVIGLAGLELSRNRTRCQAYHGGANQR
jgi:hypothetical protein